MRKNIFGRLIGAVLSAYMALGSAGLTVFAETLEEIDTIMVDDNELTDDGDKYDGGNEDSSDGDYSDFFDEIPVVDDDGAVAGGFENDYHEVTLPARSIRLKVRQTNNLEIGETFQIKYAFTPLKSDDYVTYRNFNKSIVKVDQNGLVTAVGYGEAKVQLETSGGRKKNVYFVITNEDGDENASPEKGDITGLEFGDSFIMLRVGKTFQTDVIFYPFGYYTDLIYSSENPGVAAISSSGNGNFFPVNISLPFGHVDAAQNIVVHRNIHLSLYSVWSGSRNDR